MPLSSLADSPLEHYLRDPHGALLALLSWVRDWVDAWGLLTGSAAAAVLAALWAARTGTRRHRARRLAADARLITVLAPPTVESDGAHALWANLIGLLRPAWRRRLTGQPHLAWEYLFAEGGIHIRMWVPGEIPPGLVERAIEAAWPGAHTHTTPAAKSPVVPASDGPRLLVGGELHLARSDALPLRADFPADPLRALLGSQTGLGHDEQATVQILMRPVTGRRVTRSRRAAVHLGAGHPARAVHRLLDALTPGPHRGTRVPAAPGHRQRTLETTAQDRAIVTKQHDIPYETRVRYALTCRRVPAERRERRRLKDRLRGRAHALASAFSGYSGHNHYRRARLRRPVLRLDQRRLDRGDLLSVPELAALAHIPWDIAVPGLERATARALAPPPGMPAPGATVRPLGMSDTGQVRSVGLHIADARHHLHILGATGSGKSELMGHMILADAAAGRGAIVLDPKGDLVNDLLMRLPLECAPKLVLLDADSTAPPPVLNPLDGTEATRAVDHLTSVFARIYAAYWGPRTDDILRAGLLTLTATAGIPLLTDLPRLLTDEAFRRRAAAQLDDPILRGFWAWYDALSHPARAQITAPLMNKLRGLLLRPFVRGVLAGGPSTIDMKAVLDGRILLVRLAKDTLGAETAALVGSLVVARTWQATTARARLPQQRRRDAGLYLDEAHNFLNLPYALGDMLAEARAYRLSITLAHQYLRQLPRDLEEGISTNARTKVFFNASPEDAHLLARHISPRLSEHDLSHLAAFHAAVRPVLHGTEAPAFTLATQPLPPAPSGRAAALRKALPVTAPPAHTPDPQAPRPLADPRRRPEVTP